MYARVFQLLLALLGLMSITIVNASPVVLGVTSNATIADINIPQTWRKANEYKSTDCSGPMNHEHWSPYLYQVPMDDSSHSVYLAWTDGKGWQAWSEKGRKDGHDYCYGTDMGFVPREPCLNLDHWATESTGGKEDRVKCLMYIGPLDIGCENGC